MYYATDVSEDYQQRTDTVLRSKSWLDVGLYYLRYEPSTITITLTKQKRTVPFSETHHCEIQKCSRKLTILFLELYASNGNGSPEPAYNMQELLRDIISGSELMKARTNSTLGAHECFIETPAEHNLWLH